MYSQDEINSAVAAGVMTQEAADALRAHAEAIRARPVTDEEHFRLVNSFNDIFVAIGIVILLVAAGAIGQAISEAILPAPSWPSGNVADEEYARITADYYRSDGLELALAGVFVAAASWPLAEFFTGKRRMALPSILLLVAFVGAVFTASFGTGQFLSHSNEDAAAAVFVLGSGLIALAAAWLHWRRFKVPITVAAGAAALAVSFLGLIGLVLELTLEVQGDDWMLPVIFVAGVAIFIAAMRWDMSDPTRETRRADVAFWLHLLAAPMIAHPVFTATGVIDNNADVGVFGALAVVAIYIVFGLVALAIDRRALLVSALIYVLAALAFLFDQFGAVELTFALTALVIGSALLTLSAYWSPIRRTIVGGLPGNLQAKLPAIA
ncbi:hypothetical protein ACFCW2_09845 [Qipengyuania sp. DSG2-2]|uniref:hypothetical protein n=1 Tax=Qipengyuania sp. DGS2-2 TaxID=3349631 RepID=UPI0036D30A87